MLRLSAQALARNDMCFLVVRKCRCVRPMTHRGPLCSRDFQMRTAPRSWPGKPRRSTTDVSARLIFQHRNSKTTRGGASGASSESARFLHLSSSVRRCVTCARDQLVAQQKPAQSVTFAPQRSGTDLLAFHSPNPDAPCMVYLPTLGWLWGCMVSGKGLRRERPEIFCKHGSVFVFHVQISGFLQAKLSRSVVLCWGPYQYTHITYPQINVSYIYIPHTTILQIEVIETVLRFWII